ncbi:MAG: GAF domain-containing protein, partial [Proteobacteria bacterium]|nr:GAF domain-containing protein [Pseudomonadota bacterium]
MLMKKYLGQMLANLGFITKPQLDAALQRQKQIIREKTLDERLQRVRLVSEARRSRDTQMAPLLGKILTEMDFITNEQLEQALQDQKKSFKAHTSLEGEKLGIAIEIGSLVNSTLNLAEVLQLIMQHANRVTNSVASALMLLDEKTKELVFSIPTGPKQDQLIDIRIPPGKGIAGWVAEHEQPVLVPDVKQDSRFYPNIDELTGFETKSILCVPLKAKTKLIGVLQVVNKSDGTCFSEEDELLLSMFGYQAAMAIENARLYGELTDQLKESKRSEEALQKSE